MDTKANREFADAASPLNWYEVAKLMHENAQILHNSPQGYVSYSYGNKSVFLLAAFALENLIKAYLIYENPHFIKGGKLSKKLLNGHGLSKLQQECKKIPSPKRTRHVFETLESGVNSWARYPCSTSIERQSEEKVLTDELWKAYSDVFNLYSEKLELLLSRKWKDAYGEVCYVKFVKNP